MIGAHLPEALLIRALVVTAAVALVALFLAAATPSRIPGPLTRVERRLGAAAGIRWVGAIGLLLGAAACIWLAVMLLRPARIQVIGLLSRARSGPPLGGVTAIGPLSQVAGNRCAEFVRGPLLDVGPVVDGVIARASGAQLRLTGEWTDNQLIEAFAGAEQWPLAEAIEVNGASALSSGDARADELPAPLVRSLEFTTIELGRSLTNVDAVVIAVSDTDEMDSAAVLAESLASRGIITCSLGPPRVPASVRPLRVVRIARARLGHQPKTLEYVVATAGPITKATRLELELFDPSAGLLAFEVELPADPYASRMTFVCVGECAPDQADVVRTSPELVARLSKLSSTPHRGCRGAHVCHLRVLGALGSEAPATRVLSSIYDEDIAVELRTGHSATRDFVKSLLELASPRGTTEPAQGALGVELHADGFAWLGATKSSRNVTIVPDEDLIAIAADEESAVVALALSRAHPRAVIHPDLVGRPLRITSARLGPPTSFSLSQMVVPGWVGADSLWTCPVDGPVSLGGVIEGPKLDAVRKQGCNFAVGLQLAVGGGQAIVLQVPQLKAIAPAVKQRTIGALALAREVAVAANRVTDPDLGRPLRLPPSTMASRVAAPLLRQNQIDAIVDATLRTTDLVGVALVALLVCWRVAMQMLARSGADSRGEP